MSSAGSFKQQPSLEHAIGRRLKNPRTHVRLGFCSARTNVKKAKCTFYCSSKIYACVRLVTANESTGTLARSKKYVKYYTPPSKYTTFFVKRPLPARVFLVRIQLERLHFVAAGRALHRAENAVVLEVHFQSASWEQDFAGAVHTFEAAPLRTRDETSLALVGLVGGQVLDATTSNALFRYYCCVLDQGGGS